jgi:hypothetical protein
MGREYQMKRMIVFVLTLAFLTTAISAQASVIGQWDGSARSWNDPSFTTILVLATGAGHTVTADQALTEENLALATHFLIAEPTLSLTPGEFGLLSSWLSAGGILLMNADSSGTGLPFLNDIASGLGSGLFWGPGGSTPGPLAGGNFATTGPPFDIVGLSLITSPGTAVSGGVSLSGDYLHYEAYGSGFIFGFANRPDHSALIAAGNTNDKLYQNILFGEGGAPGVPEPTTLSLLVFGLAGLASLHRRRSVS